MTFLQDSVEVKASPEAVTEYVLDPTRWQEWYLGVEQTDSDTLFPEVGGRVDLTYRAAGVAFDLTYTVIDYEEADHITWNMTGMANGTMTFRYVPRGDGTSIECEYDYDLPGGVLGQIADRAFVEKMNAENLHHSLENLQKRFG